jgi:DNA invertase Pin-like site-specific DNA recombinase
MTPASNTPAVLYLRVSSEKQGESGLGLEAQEDVCRRECERRGWDVTEVITEVQSTRKARPLAEEAMQLARDAQGVLVVADDDRMSRSTIETLLVYERSLREGWHFYACNMPNADSTTPEGKFMATVYAGIGELEREKVRRRTKRAMQAKRDRGEYVGRPNAIMRRAKDPEAAARMEKIVDRVCALREDGLSYQRIADVLNEEGVRTFKGGTWVKQYVAQTLKRYGEVS